MSEVAFISLSKLRLRYLLEQKRKNANIVQRILNKTDKLIATILVGNNFVNIAISCIGTAIFILLLGNNFVAIAVSTIVMTFFVLVLGEITPKIFAVKHAENISLNIAWFMDLLILVLEPVIRVFLNISNFILKILGVGPVKRSPLITEEEMRLMIEIGKEEGVLTDSERRMLHRIFEFGDTQVYQVMVPCEKITAIDITANADSLLDVIVEEGHSRIPVYEENLNNIRGVIYAREVLNVYHHQDLIVLRDLLHAPYLIHYKKRVSELLQEFQRLRIYMAIVIDDNKNTLGIVTVGDLLEEIVGEIDDKVG